MTPELRDYFDEQLQAVVSEVPAQVRQLLDEVPLYVEDHPSRQVMETIGVRDRRQLCGLYTGIPLTERSVHHSGVLSDVIQLYREGILELARDRQGNIRQDKLRQQIRLTLLHELGHHHGMTEEDLRELGYG